MEEKIFFDNGDVMVTNARFISNGQTYVVGNITSVKSLIEEPSRTFPVLVCIVGVLILFSNLNNQNSGGLIFGTLLIAAGYLRLKNLKPEYYVVLATSSGETKALASEDKAFIDTIIMALNDAIVRRG